jgi:hypothetical protein
VRQLRGIIIVLDRGEKYTREIETLIDVLRMCELPTELGGLGISADTHATEEQVDEILFLVKAVREVLNSADRAKKPSRFVLARPPDRRGMTLEEKILAHHVINGKGWVAPGDCIRVDVDWVIASDASWKVIHLCLTSNGANSCRIWIEHTRNWASQRSVLAGL